MNKLTSLPRHVRWASSVIYNKLGRTDMNVSHVSFGGSSLSGFFNDKIPSGEPKAIIDYIFARGINYIDTAPWYGDGNSELALGAALRGVPRSSYYIGSKVGRYKPNPVEMFDFRGERTLRSVDESLERLGIKYLDLIQVHDVEFAPSLDVIVHETLPALRQVQAAGKARYIGLTGYSLPVLLDLLERCHGAVDTVLPYCHFSLNDTTLLTHMPRLQQYGVGIINAAPFSMGLLTPGGPPSWHPAQDYIRKACAEAAAYCTKHGFDITRLAMMFSLHAPGVATTLFGTASLADTKRNLASALARPTAEESQCIEHLQKTYFAPLRGRETWEGVEVAKYWGKVGRALLRERLYPSLTHHTQPHTQTQPAKPHTTATHKNNHTNPHPATGHIHHPTPTHTKP